MKNWFKALIGTIAALTWVSLFCVGLFLDAKSAVAHLKTAFDIHEFGFAAIAFTPTNIAILTCLASLVGGCASNLVYAKTPTETVEVTAVPQERVFFLTENPAASMLRGFAVYLAFLAGVYITSEQPFEASTANQYARIAGTMSLIAFVVGYDPTLFRHFVSMLPKPGKAA